MNLTKVKNPSKFLLLAVFTFGSQPLGKYFKKEKKKKNEN